MANGFLKRAGLVGLTIAALAGAASGKSHKVESGDTYWGLSRTYKVPVSAIEGANLGKNPNQLRIGDVIEIPGPLANETRDPNEISGVTQGRKGLEEYTVRSGDNLSTLASDHGYYLNNLLSANPQIKNPDLLSVGQTIYFPAKAAERKEKKYGLEERQKRLVVLDPGHGMGNRVSGRYDPGTVSPGGYEEARLVLELAEEVGKDLKAMGFRVKYTRKDNETETPLNKRTEIHDGADFFVSLHLNGFTDPNAMGVRTYHKGNSEDEKFADFVQASLEGCLEKNVGGFTGKGSSVREGNFRVLNTARTSAILVEPGFLSNDFDRSYILRKKKELALAIAKGVKEYSDTK